MEAKISIFFLALFFKKRVTKFENVGNNHCIYEQL